MEFFSFIKGMLSELIMNKKKLILMNADECQIQRWTLSITLIYTYPWIKFHQPQ